MSVSRGSSKPSIMQQYHSVRRSPRCQALRNWPGKSLCKDPCICQELEYGKENTGWSELRCVQGAIICGIAITTIISWIPGHAASYLGPGSNLPGERPALPATSVAAPVKPRNQSYHIIPQRHQATLSCLSQFLGFGKEFGYCPKPYLAPRQMPDVPRHGSADQHRQG